MDNVQINLAALVEAVKDAMARKLLVEMAQTSKDALFVMKLLDAFRKHGVPGNVVMDVFIELSKS